MTDNRKVMSREIFGKAIDGVTVNDCMLKNLDVPFGFEYGCGVDGSCFNHAMQYIKLEG